MSAFVHVYLRLNDFQMRPKRPKRTKHDILIKHFICNICLNLYLTLKQPGHHVYLILINKIKKRTLIGQFVFLFLAI